MLKQHKLATRMLLFPGESRESVCIYDPYLVALDPDHELDGDQILTCESLNHTPHPIKMPLKSVHNLPRLTATSI